MNLGPAWSVVSSSPWILALVVIGATLIVTRLYQRIRWAHLSIRDRDPVRRFSGGARSAVMARAGNRCEHHYLYRWRCAETANLEADHVHPHSRGGSTTLGNGQVLCKRHNSLKGARIPFTWELRRIATMRRGYFPPGVDTAFVRRGSTQRPRGKSSSSRDTSSKATPFSPDASSPEAVRASIAPKEVLDLWLAVHEIDLTPDQRAAFLTHPAMAAIINHGRADIEVELRNHQKLDELATALDIQCHRPDPPQAEEWAPSELD